MAEPSLIQIESLDVGYDERLVLRDVSFEVREGEIFVIMGPSGCGKTTLLKAIVGLLEPRSGDIRYRGRSVLDLRAMEEFRRSVGMVFQQGALLNSVSLEENVALPLVEHTSLPRWMVGEVVRMKLAQVGLLEARRKLPVELSGGMRKRAGIARALVLEPDLLFFDEPTGGLDPMTADGIDNLILTLRETLGVTIVAVTHELASIFKIADRVMMLRKGEIAILGRRDEVRSSEDEEVARFIDRRAPREAGAADRFLEETGGERT
jgi:phospholipid/cholesterol/gamma-HCH transport system ATP-binding protein